MDSKTALDYNYPLAIAPENGNGAVYLSDGYGGGLTVYKCMKCDAPAIDGSAYCPACKPRNIQKADNKIGASIYANAFPNKQDRILFETFLQTKGNLEEEIALMKVEAVKIVQAESSEFKSTRERIKALTEIIDTMRKLIMTHHELFERLEISVDIDLEMVAKIQRVLETMVDKIVASLTLHITSEVEITAMKTELAEIKLWLAQELRGLF